MTRVQFLNKLYRRLESLRREQAEQYLTYYAEMLEDRMEEGMTEEEAVAEMEDIDTIARRILQDEGVSWQPPRYPDPPRTQNTFHPLQDTEKTAWDWREPARVGLWVLAILVASWAIFSKLTGYKNWEPTLNTEMAPAITTGILEDISITESPSKPPADVIVNPNGIYVSDGEYEVAISSEGLQVHGADGETQFFIGPDGIQIGGEYAKGWDFGDKS